MTVLNRPLPDHEDEFHDLLRDIAIATGLMPDDHPTPTGFLARLMGKRPPKPSQAQIDAMLARFNAISTPADLAIDAPVVAQDAAADAWVTESMMANGKSADDARQAIAQLAGYRVLQLAEPCDGLPVYSNGAINPDMDLTSFRGAFLDTCKDILPKAEIAAAWNVMTASELVAYGERLALHCQTYAAKHGLKDQLGQRIVDWDDETAPNAQLHIVDSLSRWALFWGKRGHGSNPDF